MANDRPAGDWRHPSGAKPAGKPGAAGASATPGAPRTSRRAWQPGGSEAPPPPRPRTRRPRLFAAGCATFVLVAVAVWLFTLFGRTEYPPLAVVGAPAGEALALPADPAAIPSALEVWAGDTKREGLRLDPNPAFVADGDGVRAVVDPDARNLVMYFTAPGGADTKGAFVLVTPDARKLYVHDILDRVTPRGDKPTLLVFDCTRAVANWPHGLIFNDFARALRELDEKIAAIEGLAVICASDEDQRSWPFEERGASAFGYYFLEALKGAGHARGARVTAATAFDHAAAEVEKWAVANRNEKQRPILLPAGDRGRERAARIDLAAVPPGGYESPPLDAPKPIPEDLRSEWVRAEEIDRQVPRPEANTPARWREYLDLLLRWENQFRIGADTAAVRDRIQILGPQLRNPPPGRELRAVSAAAPAARALGRPPAFADAAAAERFAAEFRAKVWDAQGPDERSAAWRSLLNASKGRETAARTAAAVQVLVRLDDEGATAAALQTAAQVLALTHGDAGQSAPAEAHYVRMLHAFLDPAGRPDAGRLKPALDARRRAEEAAWVFQAKPDEYAYPESVLPWVLARVTAGDRKRQLGQDLLFSADPDDWKTAADHFRDAQVDYDAVRDEGGTVAAALAARDRAFARLPYYARWLVARWLAVHRDDRAAAEVDRLIGRAAAAFDAAHAISGLTANDPPPPDRLADLARLREQLDGHFAAVKDAFDAHLDGLTNTAQPANWHALDAALAVPFIKANKRGDLLGFLRHASRELEANRQQPKGAEPPAPMARQAAERHGRLAFALLGGADKDRDLLDRPEPSAWWRSYRAAGAGIADRFRALSADATRAYTAARAADLRAIGPLLTAAAVKARVADPAFPVAGDAVAADTRFRRHRLLLRHAHRVTDEGWADVVPTGPDEWYCRKVAEELVKSAAELVRETAAEVLGRPPLAEENARWLAECVAEGNYRAVVLQPAPAGVREIADEPYWDYTYRLAADAGDVAGGWAAGGRIGYPVTSVTVPPPPCPQPDANTRIGRRLEKDFYSGRAAAERTVRLRAGPLGQSPDGGKLAAKTLYRGHEYLTETAVALVGAPTHQWTHNPPAGPACFGVGATRADIAGAVTILLDLTDSMNKQIDGTETRLGEAMRGVRKILTTAILPEGTEVHFAYFYGNKEKTDLIIRPLGRPVKLDGTRQQGGAVYNQFEKDFLVEFADGKAPGWSTPLAGAIAAAVKDGTEFWPKKSTGSRTLIVLTDGEDNYRYEKEPGAVALDALLGTPDDVNLHVVFFGLKSEKDLAEEKRAVAQFAVLSNPANYAQKPDKTPAKLWSAIPDADALARTVSGVLVPKYRYAGGPADRQVDKQIEVTIRDAEDVSRATPGLLPGEYRIRSGPRAPQLRVPQTLQVRPADRVLVQTRRGPDGNVELYLPPYAFETAEREQRPREAARDKAATGGIYGTVPAFEVDFGGADVNLRAAMTLELIGERRDADHLEVVPPKFVWFDVNRIDGKPPERGPKPAVRIENMWPVWAPAWKLDVDRWAPAAIEKGAVPRPAFTGYWLESWPVAAGGYTVNLNDLPASLARLRAAKTDTVSVGRNATASLVTLDVEPYAPRGGPAGRYLTVRLKYDKGELVFLRAGNLKGPNQYYQLYQQHTYYDDCGRYTARFGPLLDGDPQREVKLDLHAVADLKEKAKSESRSVVVEVRAPDGEKLPKLTMPQRLKAEPGNDGKK